MAPGRDRGGRAASHRASSQTLYPLSMPLISLTLEAHCNGYNDSGSGNSVIDWNNFCALVGEWGVETPAVGYTGTHMIDIFSALRSQLGQKDRDSIRHFLGSAGNRQGVVR